MTRQSRKYFPSCDNITYLWVSTGTASRCKGYFAYVGYGWDHDYTTGDNLVVARGNGPLLAQWVINANDVGVNPTCTVRFDGVPLAGGFEHSWEPGDFVDITRGNLPSLSFGVHALWFSVTDDEGGITYDNTTILVDAPTFIDGPFNFPEYHRDRDGQVEWKIHDPDFSPQHKGHREIWNEIVILVTYGDISSTELTVSLPYVMERSHTFTLRVYDDYEATSDSVWIFRPRMIAAFFWTTKDNILSQNTVDAFISMLRDSNGFTNFFSWSDEDANDFSNHF